MTSIPVEGALVQKNWTLVGVPSYLPQKKNPMRIGRSWLALVFVVCGGILRAQPKWSKEVLAVPQLKLPNGWSLTPAGKQLPMGDFPLNIAVSPDKKYAAVTNNGQSAQSIFLVDLTKDVVLDSIEVAKSFYGLCFDADGRSLFASGGNDNQILKFQLMENRLVLIDSVSLGGPWPTKISPVGIALNTRQRLLYAATKEDNSLYIVNIDKKTVLSKIELPGEGYACLLSNDQKELYVSCWGCGKIVVVNTATQQISDTIAVGSHPNEIALAKSGKYLYVANAEDNSVSIVDLKQRKTIETLDAAIYPGSLAGSTTNGVALGNGDQDLYVANADNNCIAVFDISDPGRSVPKGFVPVGWYPTCVRAVGNKILVANGKGYASLPNPKGPNPLEKHSQMAHHLGEGEGGTGSEYIGGLFKGGLSIIEKPTKKELEIYTALTMRNTPYDRSKDSLADGEDGNPVPKKIGAPSPIQHVFYIIKENRTYDQVLGDMYEGNGKSSLCLFGENITPNQHALAREFVLLDNFFVDGEVSADGHHWTMGGYANDYLEKTWPTNYGRRGGNYDGEGTRPIARNKKGFLWDMAKQAGATYRSYGEFVEKGKANIPVLEGHFCESYPGWDPSFPDTARANLWMRDFDSLLAIGQLPKLSTIRLPNDHTEGLKLDKPTPMAHVADNDLAVGMVIEHLAKSPIWNESLVLIVEDDAQDGADHVDAHRSPAFLAGGYVKRKFVDHTPYSTTSLLRTMELILGLAPMSQYDAGATALWRCFEKVPQPSSFLAKQPLADRNEKNKTASHWQKLSEKFDFSHEDKVPDRLMSEVVWRAVKGLSTPMPSPVRAAFFRPNKDDDD